MAAEIDGVVRTLLIEEFKIDEADIKPEATFKEMGLDSLDVVSLVMALEDRLNVEIPESELEGVERLENALDLLEKKLAART
jgi:acyl carrier protein